MRVLLYTILFFLSINAYSQPGDIFAWKANRIKEINSLLEIDTNNHQLLWERLDIFFNPHFDIYTKTRKPASKSDLIVMGDEPQLAKTYKSLNILADLNFLIADTSVVIKDKGYQKAITNAHFHYKRGQYYYLNGRPKKALKDYLIALNMNPHSYLLNRISISIAAYYYNLDKTFNLSNLEKALKYIDIAIPKEIENTPETFDRFTDRNHHPFEREKIMLLKHLNKDERLKNYRKSLAKSHLNLYTEEIKKSEDYQKNHSYTIPHTLETGLNYLFKIAETHYKAKEYEKAKRILVFITDYIPKHQINYKTYDKYYFLLQDLYTKDCCKDTFLEIDNILNISGSLNYNLRGKNVSSEIKKIDKLIKTNPENPKLFLAKAILIYKDSKLNPKPTIINLLDTTQNLGLVDYRIPYLKGLVFKQQLKYKEAINQFEKAIVLFKNDHFLYRAKLEILEKIPNYEHAKIKAIQEKIKYLPLPITNKIPELINQIDEF